MPTSYDIPENLFLGEIADESFLNYEETDRKEILDGYLMKAITRFKACKKDLTDKNDTLREFNCDLSNEEIYIISVCMKKPWLSDKIYNLELIKQRMSNKDFRLTSQAEHLLRLTVLNQELDKEISRMIVDYTTYAYSVSNK